MGVQRTIGIISALYFVPTCNRFRQNNPVAAFDLPPYNTVRQAVQPRVIRIIDHIFPLKREKISLIANHEQKQTDHHISNAKNIFI